MRVVQVAFLVVVGLSMEATAGPRSGGGSSGGGGRLASVSAGIGGATGASSGRRGPRTTGTANHWAVACPYDHYRRRVYDGRCVRRCPAGELYRASDGACVRRTIAVVTVHDPMLEAEAQGTLPAPRRTAHVAGYVGAQKVFESDGAIALELAVSDRRLRLAGALTRFYERQPSGDTLTLTMPSLALGVRIDDSDSTRVYLEAGAAGALTKHDPMMMDSSITGALGGVVVEHSVSKHTTLMGAARLMGFQDDVRATSARVGVRFRHVQASFSILDFNVGPALYGPEIGVGF